MAEVLLRQNRADEAAEYLRAALRSNPSHSQTNVLLARYLLRTAQRDEALSRMRTALRAKAGPTDLYVLLGSIPNALAFAQQLEQLGPKSPGAAALTGWVLLSQSNPKGAVPAFQRAVALKPELPEAHRGLGETCQALGEIDPRSRATGARWPSTIRTCTR